MDTSWFAVDGDGHVALFHTGEAGALPADSCAYEAADTVERRLEEVMPAVTPILDAQGRTARRGPAERAWSADYPVVLMLASLVPVREAIKAGRAIQLEATEGYAVLLPTLSREELDRYHQLPELRGSFNLYRQNASELTSPARWGVYEYDHTTENWVSGPYARITLPAQPLHIDQLPPDVRKLLAGPRLQNVRFPDAPLIQPVEHAECVSWESAYLDVAFRRIRPIPGKEAEYAVAYGEYYSGDSGEYEVEPPAKEGAGPNEDE
jgi:hypothetical protein